MTKLDDMPYRLPICDKMRWRALITSVHERKLDEVPCRLLYMQQNEMKCPLDVPALLKFFFFFFLPLPLRQPACARGCLHLPDSLLKINHLKWKVSEQYPASLLLQGATCMWCQRCGVLLRGSQWGRVTNGTGKQEGDGQRERERDRERGRERGGQRERERNTGLQVVQF